MPLNPEQFQLRPPVIEDCRILWEMRNQPRIRELMFDPNPIPWEVHQKWFHNLNSQMVRILTMNGQPCGFLQWKPVSPEKMQVYSWGFYVFEPGKVRGLGLVLGMMGLDYAFGELNAITIIGDVAVHNQISCSFHESLGFECNPESPSASAGNGRIPFVSYEISAEKWHEYRRKIDYRLFESG